MCVDTPIGAAAVDAAIGDRGREINSSTSIGLPFHLALTIQCAEHAAAISDKGEATGGDRCGGHGSRGRFEAPGLLDICRQLEGGGGSAAVIALVNSPVILASLQFADAVNIAFASLELGAGTARTGELVSRSSKTDVSIERKLTATHPGSPEEVAIRNNHPILAGGSHGCDVLGGIAWHVHAHSAATGPEENTINTAGGPGTGTSPRHHAFNISGGIIEHHASF